MRVDASLVIDILNIVDWIVFLTLHAIKCGASAIITMKSEKNVFNKKKPRGKSKENYEIREGIGKSWFSNLHPFDQNISLCSQDLHCEC